MGNLIFDRIQRYYLIREILSRVYGRESMRLLDVGGGTGELKEILEHHRYYSIDLQGGGISHLRGSMLHLPFTSDSFDCVLMVDALEHIPDIHRQQALREMSRVSKDLLIWIGPYEDPLITQVESDLCQTHRNLLAGREMEWLLEHRKHGLPAMEKVFVPLSSSCSSQQTWFACNLQRWWLLKRLDLLLEAGIHQPDLIRQVDQWYLQVGWITDYCVHEPAYRFVFAGRKHHPLPENLSTPPQDLSPLDNWRWLIPLFEKVCLGHQLNPDGLPLSDDVNDKIKFLAALFLSQPARPESRLRKLLDRWIP